MKIAGPNSPTVEVNDASIGSLAWGGNIGFGSTVEDGSYTTGEPLNGQITNFLKVTGFGFNIPASAIIRAIVPRLKRSAITFAQPVFDHAVRIVKGGVIGTVDRASPTAWPGAPDAYINYNADDLWGQAWTAADINSPNFGWALAIKSNEPDFTQAVVDHMPLLVAYEELTEADSAQVAAAEAIAAELNAGSFSLAFTAVRSYAQWQRPFEVAEAVGLQVDVVPFPPTDDGLQTRGSVKYSPTIDVVIRQKFAAADLEQVPGDNTARVKIDLVDARVALLEEINEALAARRIGGGQVAWNQSKILYTYLAGHLRDKHQYTGVIRVSSAVVKDLS